MIYHNNIFFLVDQHFRTEEKLGKAPVSYGSYEEIYERLRKGKDIIIYIWSNSMMK